MSLCMLVNSRVGHHTHLALCIGGLSKTIPLELAKNKSGKKRGRVVNSDWICGYRCRPRSSTDHCPMHSTHVP
ncbi:hypothetical protein BDP55DRAFT_678355 [Colletotrichum godetiae]|uniref:Uncharacterized protein n=1 Tax=Colletotrichum godetiae TaxID=1209918 RepID=A0AAJ0AC22_9PEZI|nr:uncharacterized protein BDP55DRAFT_678355 [Colletotrichum godetiae]KAK1659753.1 hypothetical protein BDP55DRAFT_678355 [Colletotrichum godetiae]